MLTYSQAYKELKEILVNLYDKNEANAIADILLTHITGKSYTQRLIDKETALTALEKEQYDIAKAKLLHGTPIQYITHTAHFMAQQYYVDENVLIPRPETEELVQWVIDEYNGQEVSILDIGTGSGCIPISLKIALPKCTVTSIDVSNTAIHVAKQNAMQLNAEVRFLEHDFLNINKHINLGNYDIIVSNPPYIPESEMESLDINVREHEPATALFVPNNDALLFYRLISEFGKSQLKTNGSIYCEIHQSLSEETESLFQISGYKTELRKDIFNNYRMIRAKK